ncbi:MAG TPA: TPM domain-containing protein [Vicinamibacterales bacterium]|nr:TPM domain-containing protein [Vicinamibacterales bacterium]
MRRFLIVALLLLAPALVHAQEPPPELTRPVNDFANVLDPESERELDELIRKLLAASGDTIVVATVKTFQPSPDIQTYATAMFQNGGRGIGQKGKDNGLLLVLAVDDREVRAEVGYDLEGFITDGFAGETSRQTMVPFFRTGDYGGGLVAGATVFAQRIAQGRNVTLDGLPARPVPAQRPQSGGDFPFILIIFFAMVLINVVRSAMGALFGRRGGKRRRGWGSTVGPFGAGYGGWSSGGGGWSGGGGFGGGFGGFGGGRSGGGGGGGSW